MTEWMTSADEDIDSKFPSNVVVDANGSCSWIPLGLFISSCAIDIQWFPFDEQKCLLKFGSWSYDGNSINMTMLDGEEGAVQLDTYQPSGEWQLVGQQFHVLILVITILTATAVFVVLSSWYCHCDCESSPGSSDEYSTSTRRPPTSGPIAYIHCLKNVTLFIFLWYLCQILSDSGNFWQKHTPGNLKQTHCMPNSYLVLYVRTLPCKQTLATRQNAHCDIGRFPFVLSLNRNVATSLKAYFNFWNSYLHQTSHELTFYLQKL